MRSLLAVLLVALPACSVEMVSPDGGGVPPDAGFVGDGAAAPDAGMSGDGAFGRDGDTADAGTPVGDAGMGMADAWMTMPLDGGPGTSDGGPASTDAGSASPLCGNGYIDPGEVCDPGVFTDAGVVPWNRRACPTCTAHDCSAYALPATLSTPGAYAGLDPVNNWCIVYDGRARVFTGDPSIVGAGGAHDLVYWELAAEHAGVTQALSDIVTQAAADGATVSGQLSLRWFVSGGPYRFYRPDASSASAVDLPTWSSPPGTLGCATVSAEHVCAVVSSTPCRTDADCTLPSGDHCGTGLRQRLMPVRCFGVMVGDLSYRLPPGIAR